MVNKYNEIELSAGHRKASNSGAVGYLKEAVENRRVCRRVKEILQASNVPLTYYEDDVTSNQRDNVNYLVAKHNEDTGAFVCQIHFNASKTTDKPVGTEVLYANPALAGVAARISSAISKATGGGLIDRGAKVRDNIGVLTRTKEHAILIEVCFVDSRVDAAIYNRDFEKICQAIAKELALQIGYNLKGKEETPVKQPTNVPSPWAKEAVEWAKSPEVNLTDGTDLKGPVTREQMITMLHRYDQYQKRTK